MLSYLERYKRFRETPVWFEMIPIKQLKPTSLPAIITEDIKELAVFRYSGDNRPFVCLIMDCVIYPIFIEAKFGDIYDHGSK